MNCCDMSSTTRTLCFVWCGPTCKSTSASPHLLSLIPRIDETLDTLSGAHWFSTLDLTSGYWQVELEAEDREKTAFSTPFGFYQFKLKPFGLSIAHFKVNGIGVEGFALVHMFGVF